MRRTRPEYATYAARTSGFYPWFSKRQGEAPINREP